MPTGRYVPDRSRPLSPREREVLVLLAVGATDQSISRRLGITSGTAKTHAKHIIHRLEATSREHAVMIARERGLIRQDEPA